MPRRVLKGKVVSAKSQNTLIVRVGRISAHPKFGKIVKKTKKYAAHYSEGLYQEGDLVSIIECAPISKTKTWQVIDLNVIV